MAQGFTAAFTAIKSPACVRAVKGLVGGNTLPALTPTSKSLALAGAEIKESMETTAAEEEEEDPVEDDDDEEEEEGPATEPVDEDEEEDEEEDEDETAAT